MDNIVTQNLTKKKKVLAPLKNPADPFMKHQEKLSEIHPFKFVLKKNKKNPPELDFDI